MDNRGRSRSRGRGVECSDSVLCDFLYGTSLFRMSFKIILFRCFFNFNKKVMITYHLVTKKVTIFYIIWRCPELIWIRFSCKLAKLESILPKLFSLSSPKLLWISSTSSNQEKIQKLRPYHSLIHLKDFQIGWNFRGYSHVGDIVMLVTYS